MGPAKVATTDATSDAAYQTLLRPNFLIGQIVDVVIDVYVKRFAIAVAVGVDVPIDVDVGVKRFAIVVYVVIVPECRCERPALPSRRAIIGVGIGAAAASATRPFDGRTSCVGNGRKGADCVDGSCRRIDDEISSVGGVDKPNGCIDDKEDPFDFADGGEEERNADNVDIESEERLADSRRLVHTPEGAIRVDESS